MNKTVNINLGGMFFHIDEDAYQKLTRYFEAIRRSLSKSSGQEEIIKDIEIRVSELLNEKQKTDKHVVGIKEVDEVIAVMGQPEDYIIEEDNQTTQHFSDTNSRGTKKLYRDKEKGMIGGVATGLGHYFGIDAVWLKIMFLIFVFAGFGTGIIAYIVLWIVTPEAITTSEKLEMTGEPVTISNIEKKVREEIDSLSGKFKNTDFDKVGHQVKTGAEKLGNSFSDFVLTVFKIFAKFLGVLLIITGFTMLFFLLVGVFTLGTNVFIDFPWQNFIETGQFTDYPAWAFGLLMFFAVGIPFFFLTILGFKLLSPNMKSIGTIAKYTLLALWLIAIAITISIGVRTATQVAYDGKTVQKQIINLKPTDTLFVKFKYNENYTNNIDDRDEFKFLLNNVNQKVIYSNNVSIKILSTDEKAPYLQIEKTAKGESFQDAKQRAEKIEYGFKIEGSHLVLDNYLLTDVKNKFRGQEVELYLYVPEGMLLQPDATVENYDRSDNEFFNMHYSSDTYVYKVTNSQIKCLNCPADEDEYNDVANDDTDNVEVNINDNVEQNDSITTTTVKVNGQTVTVNKAGSKKGLTVNKEGVIIKK
ncbi:PspC domain-containing protein [Flavobacterium restrictum]|uniref:PspC domain-containing protein n=1 Tax=Flavobacterium restrictum TaxID=2594428 RepID=A0A553E292_9FLAO|nr:PspC domain-containing protein [Flavobacterium restrictum]TRX39168.1 PspC domain-containing protein [Flavobacterium restrictum]